MNGDFVAGCNLSLVLTASVVNTSVNWLKINDTFVWKRWANTGRA